MVGDQAQRLRGPFALGTVKGDLYEISKALVGTILIAIGCRDICVEKAASEFIDITKDLGAGTAFWLMDALSNKSPARRNPNTSTIFPRSKVKLISNITIGGSNDAP